MIGVAPHVLGAGDALKVAYNRRQSFGHANASLEYNDLSALDLASSGFPYEDMHGFPSVRVAHLALEIAVLGDALRADREPSLRSVAFPEAGTVRAHVPGDAEIPRFHSALETALRTAQEGIRLAQPELERLLLHPCPGAP